MEHNRKYRVNNKEKLVEYRVSNRDKLNAKVAKRRATKLKQTPVLTEQELNTVKLYYKLSTAIGNSYEVDHVIPLAKGGLHHPDNLQILHAEDNRSKGARIKYKYKYPRYRVVCGQLIKTKEK